MFLPFLIHCLSDGKDNEKPFLLVSVQFPFSFSLSFFNRHLFVSELIMLLFFLKKSGHKIIQQGAVAE
jgi:hypothetical protein